MPDEAFSNEELIKERYEGIRPAPGYPACPDHTEKGTLFRLLDASETLGVELTEHFAMHPAASVSGFYFSHREATYFGLGKIDDSQVKDYARERGGRKQRQGAGCRRIWYLDSLEGTWAYPFDTPQVPLPY